MLRKLVILGIFAGSSASVPILYKENPEAFQNFFSRAFEESEPEAKPERPMIVVQQAKPEKVRYGHSANSVRLPADERGHYTADFKLNGRSIEALIDTGATLVAVNRSTARRLGINLAASDFKYTVNTANGSTQAASAMIETIQVGRIQVRDVQAVVLEDNALQSTLVGMSFLKRLSGFKVEYGELLLEQ